MVGTSNKSAPEMAIDIIAIFFEEKPIHSQHSVHQAYQA